MVAIPPSKRCQGCGVKWAQRDGYCATCATRRLGYVGVRQQGESRVTARQLELDAIRPIIIPRAPKFVTIAGVDYEITWP